MLKKKLKVYEKYIEGNKFYTGPMAVILFDSTTS